MYVWYRRMMTHNILISRYTSSWRISARNKKPPSCTLAALIGAVTIQTVRVTADTFPAFWARCRKLMIQLCHECVKSVKPKNIGGPGDVHALFFFAITSAHTSHLYGTPAHSTPNWSSIASFGVIEYSTN